MVPAYNEEAYLAATLESIHAAAREAGELYEIVVANDSSTDATSAIAGRAGARVVDVAKRQIAGTRNAGARASLGEFLVFVDADTHVHAALVRQALAALRSGAVGGG
ncbi:MAG TPA: glycosyltransferase family A protein, partial [Usitatibacter sp.]|nr:glycosyltransferase family A protein [Usitatibacter sp.]